tara:strand:- start:171 stop:503 length:333 start_codon:yes stop_codon:yes gene_type:complete
MTEIMTRERLIIWLEEVAFQEVNYNQTFQILEDDEDGELTVCFKVRPKETYCEMAFREMIESFGVTLWQAEVAMDTACSSEYGAALNGEDFDYLRTMINQIYRAGKENVK